MSARAATGRSAKAISARPWSASPAGATNGAIATEQIARAEPDGDNPGRDYVRVALVHDADTTREALTRIVATLG